MKARLHWFGGPEWRIWTRSIRDKPAGDSMDSLGGGHGSPPSFFGGNPVIPPIQPVENSEIARIFSEVADFLELKKENPFRIRSYRNASRIILNWPDTLSDLVLSHQKLPKIPGIGKDLEGKIIEICTDHSLDLHKKLTREIPKGLLSLMKIPGIGPIRAKKIFDQFNIQSIEQLRLLAESGGLEKIPGFGSLLVKNIIGNIRELRLEQERILWPVAKPVADALLAYLEKKFPTAKFGVAGSYRRGVETVGDLDILASGSSAERIHEVFLSYPGVKKILASGPTRSAIELDSGLQVDLRVVKPQSLGSAMVYFTGSKSHNIGIRAVARKSGLKMNEYGVFQGKKAVASRTEAEVYHAIGLSYIEPELRENQGEIEAAKKDCLPNLIRIEDLRGDLHVHSRHTDGDLSISELARLGINRGYEYIAITDHTQHLRIAKGLSPKEVRRELEEIDRLNESLKGITLLKGSEVDILEDGTLDLPQEILDELDLVVCAVHSSFGLSRSKQMKRIIRAIHHPCVSVLAHPSGRLIQQRQPIDLDMKLVIEEVVQVGCALEINGQPRRMDLEDVWIREAKKRGAVFSVVSDAHSALEMDFVDHGIRQARRGWLEKTDVINAWSLPDLKTFLGAKS